MLFTGGLLGKTRVKRMGVDFTITVNVVPDIDEREQRTHKEPDAREPNIIHVIMQSLHIAIYSLVRSSLEESDIVIESHVAHIPAGDFHPTGECILQG